MQVENHIGKGNFAVNLSDFFKKEPVIFPSGRRAAERGCRNSAYDHVLSSMGKAAVGIAFATSMVACGSSQEEINAMKAQVPRRDSLELVSAYDASLLANIDSLHNAGDDMKKAVKKGVALTWEQAKHSFGKSKTWSGKEYIVEDHADKRLNESRDRHEVVTLVPVPVPSGKSTTMVLRPRTVVSYIYKEEFRDQLASEIQQRQKTQAAQSARTVNAVRGSGR